MGIFDGWKERKRVKEAAKQIWELLKRGYNFEVPLILDRNDLTVQAVTEVQRRHPQVQLRMYQSRGMVLGLFRGEGMRGNVGIAEATVNQLANSGHIDSGYETMKPEDLLASHERFLKSQRLDPKEEEATAQAERAAREAITVGGVGAQVPTAVVAAPVESVAYGSGLVETTADGAASAK